MLVHARGIGLEPAAGFLRGVHGDVGAPKERLGVLAVRRIDRDAETARDVERQPFDRDRLAELLQEASGDRERDLVVGKLGQQHPELVTAQAGHDVVVTQHRRQPGPDLLQQLIAEMVAQGVVDLLEVVEVHEHHRDAALPQAGGVDSLREPRLEHHAVGEARERVVHRLVLVLGLLRGELHGRFLQRMRSGEHLSRERERRDEHEDRQDADLLEGRRDEHAEHREAHVAQDELTEQSRMDVTPCLRWADADAQVVVDAHESDVDHVPGDRRQHDRHAQTPPFGFQSGEQLEDRTLDAMAAAIWARIHNARAIGISRRSSSRSADPAKAISAATGVG